MIGAMRNPLAVITRTNPRVTAAASVPIAVPHRWTPANRAALFSRVNAETQLEASAENSTVGSIVHRISSDVARQQFVLEQTATGRGRLERRTLDNHAFLDLLAAPNRRMTPTQRAFMQLAGTYLELLGEACILVVTANPAQPGGQPIELYPLRPDRLTPVPDPNEWLAGWIYQAPGTGEQIPLRWDQIVQVKYPNPADPYRGLSPLVAAFDSVLTSSMAAEYEARLFENMGIPGGLITTDQALEPHEFREWVERWNEQHQGVANAGRIAMMDRGGSFIPQAMSIADMQLTELLSARAGTIREAWGISKTILGQNEDVNRATALAAEQIYGRYTLRDRVDLWLEFGNELLRRYASVSRLGRRPKYELAVTGDLVPADVEVATKDRNSRVKAWQAYVAEGADPADAAEVFDLPVVEFDEPPPAPVVPFGAPAIALPGNDQDNTDDDDEGGGGGEGGVTARFRLPDVTARARPTAPPEGFPPLDQLDETHQRILDRLVDDWADAETEQKALLVAAVLAILQSGNLADLETLTVDTTTTRGLLTDAAVEAGVAAAELTATEAREQGADDIEPAPVDRVLVGISAGVVAGLIASRLVASASGTALRLHTSGADPADVAAGVETALADLSTDGPRARLGGVLTGTENEARMATVEAGPVAAVFANEILDRNTCGPCARIDGTLLGWSDDPDSYRAHYPAGASGGYKGCEGRERCRGTISFLYLNDPN